MNLLTSLPLALVLCTGLAMGGCPGGSGTVIDGSTTSADAETDQTATGDTPVSDPGADPGVDPDATTTPDTPPPDTVGDTPDPDVPGPDAVPDAIPDTPVADTPVADTPVADTPVADTPTADTPTPDVPSTDGGSGDTTTTDTDGGSTSPVDCNLVAAAPIAYTTLQDFATGEDYAIAANGDYISNENGNLVRKVGGTGPLQLFVPNLGFTAGMGFLPGGDLIVASVDTGSLLRITPAGGQTTLLSGLQYPNGLDIDYDGTVFIAEQDAQRLRAVNPDTGDFFIVADDICNANGVSFDVDYDRVYVGSFGCGLVYGIDRLPDGSWDTPFEIGENGLADPGATPTGPTPWCSGASMLAGDLCGTSQLDAGTCEDDGNGALVCTATAGAEEPLLAACSGMGSGDACAVKAAGLDWNGVCSTNPWLGGGLRCNIDDDPICTGAQQGDQCLKLSYGYMFYGTCSPAGFGGSLRCNGEPGGSSGSGTPPIGTGGLDGLNVDVCGNIYVTEYTTGGVWRIPPDLSAPEEVVNLPSYWIPNMHWGNGVGMWDPNTLYIADRDQGRLFAIEIGVPGKETTKPAAP